MQEVTPNVVQPSEPDVAAIKAQAEATKIQTKLLREQAIREGVLPLNEESSFDDFRRTRDNGERLGVTTEIEPTEQQPRDSDGKFTTASTDNAQPEGESDAEPGDAPDVFTEMGLEENHPHRARVAEAQEWHGPTVINAVAQRLASVQVAPGIAKMIANFDNSVDMLIEFANHENPEQIGAFLSSIPKAKAQQFLAEVSKNLRGNQQEAVASKAPKAISPISKSAPTDSRLHDGLEYKEWVRRREAQLKR